MLNNSSLYSGFVHTRPETNWSSKEFVKKNLKNVDFSSEEPLKSGGIPVISDGKRGYIDVSDNHVAIFGSSGFKKSLTVYMPLICTLAKAGESLFVTDPKGELYERTAGFLKAQGYKIRVINLRDHNGECYNPLYYPAKLSRDGDIDKASIVLSNIIDAFAKKQESGPFDPFWPLTAKAYISGVINLMINCFPTIDSVNLMNLAGFMVESNAESLKVFLKDYPVNNTAITNIQSVLSEPSKTLQSSLATAASFFQPFIQNDKVCREICSSSFELDELAEEKTAFFVITDDSSSAFNPIVSILISQLQNILIDKAFHSEGGKLKTRVNFILDEFCSFPVPSICEALATHRSRNIRYFLCIQSIDLLEKVYSNYQSILTNCATTLFLGSSEMRLLREISERCGMTTVNSREIPEPLVSTAELMTLKKSWESKEMLYLNTAMPARYCTELPAIEGYESFCGFDCAELPEIKHPRIELYGMKELLNDLDLGITGYPFRSEKPRFSTNANGASRPNHVHARRSKKLSEFLD